MPRTISCAGCHQSFAIPDDILPGPMTCPHCHAAIEVPQVPSEAGDPMSAPARPWWRRVSWWCLNAPIVLTSLAILSVFLTSYFSAQPRRAYWVVGVMFQLAALFAFLDLLVTIALASKFVPMVTRSLEDPEEPRRARLSGWQIMVGMVVVLIVAVAVVAFFFATCVGMSLLLEQRR